MNKYGNFLTILLIVTIVFILFGGFFLLYRYVIKPNNDRNQKIEAIAEFDKEIDNDGNDEENQPEEQDIDDSGLPENTGNRGTVRTKQTYKGFVMLGYITIPKTNVNEPILDVVTAESLNTAVAALYPSNPQLNEPGNVVIIGHNYKNGQFFSNNKKLEIGDKLTIKDNSGRELTYTIYDKFEASENDTSFYNRNTNGAVEVTLSTCTDDSKERTIILARAE